MRSRMSGKVPGNTTALVITHVIALGLGCAMWGMIDRSAGLTGAANDASVRSDRKSQERRTGRQAREKKDGERLLNEMTGWIQERHETGTAERLPNWMGRTQAGRDAHYEAINLAADELPVAADIPGAAMAAIRDCFRLQAGMTTDGMPINPDAFKDLQSRMLHWMRADPKGMIAFLSTSEDEAVKNYGRHFLNGTAQAALMRTGPEAAVEWLKIDKRFANDFQGAIAWKLGEAGDFAQLERVRGNVDAKDWPNFRNSILGTWPVEKADDLLALARSENNPGILSYYASQHNAGAWLLKQLNSDTLDDAAKEMIKKRPEFRQLMVNSQDVDFETRIGYLSAFEKEKSVEQLKLEIGGRDVTRALNDGRDWRYAFRNGAVTADEVYQGMISQLPDLASASPEALKLQLYKELAEDNGTAALKLLDDVPAEKRWETAMKSPRWMFNDINPQDFYNFLQQIPAEPNEEVWTLRLGAWADRSNRNHNRLGSDYVQWVEALPQGVDREMASYNLLKTTGNGDPELNARLRAEVKDPRLLERLAKMNK